MLIGRRRRPKDARPHELDPKFVAKQIKQDLQTEQLKPLTPDEARNLHILEYALSGLKIGSRKP
jgi:hypothetical protein